MSLPIHIALVPDGVDLDITEITRVAAALSKQVDRDFRPLWHINATVDGFARLEDVPVDYWPIIVQRDVHGAAGFHQDKDGQPFAVVQFDNDWSLTASHECLEMLADPFGRRLRAADLLPQAVALGLHPARVRYLVEVCDPSEGGEFAYSVNGVTVSDFYTPHYFDPVKVAGVRYSFTGAIASPRMVLAGGYISWQDTTNGHWMQLRMFPDEFSTHSPHVLDLTANTKLANLQPGDSIRAAIDRVTNPPHYAKGLASASFLMGRPSSKGSEQGQGIRAESLRAQIAGLKDSA